MDRPSAPAHTSTVLPSIPDVELLEVIGSGASGVVYRGRQPTFGRDVAVKVVSSPGAPGAVERWERELSAMGRLSNHPNIVAVYAGGVTESGSPFLVMPYVPGGTLHDRMDREGPMPPAEVATIGAKLAGALAEAHEVGVLHRDVKPENVLLSPYGEPQLADFGIARVVDSTITVAGSVLATIPYAAPEVVTGEGATEASDVYGLGATLHACLTGVAPFAVRDEDTMVSLVTRVATQSPEPLATSGVPAPLAAVIERAMHKDPAARQSSASELQRELDAVAEALRRGDDQPDTMAVPAATAGVGTTSVFAPEPASSGPTSTQVLPAAPAPATREAPRRPEPASGRQGDGRGLVVALLLATLAVIGLVGWALLGGDDGRDQATEQQDSAPAEVPEAEQPTDDADEADEPEPTEPPATEPADDAPAAGGDLAGASVTYLETLESGDFDAAWQLTSPSFRANQDRASWEGFWGSFDSIEVVGDLRIDEAAGSVVIPLSLDGQREDYRMTLVRGDGGSWLIDGPTGG
jgi:hypothetical protein